MAKTKAIKFGIEAWPGLEDYITDVQVSYCDEALSAHAPYSVT